MTRRPPYCPCLPPVAVSPAPGAFTLHASQRRRLRTVPTAPAKPQGRRAGFCTYNDQLDNAGSASADRILPEYQHLQVGDWMPMAKKISDTTAFKATALRPVSRSVAETGQYMCLEADPPRCRSHGAVEHSLVSAGALKPGQARLVETILQAGPARVLSAQIQDALGERGLFARRLASARRSRARPRPGRIRWSSWSRHLVDLLPGASPRPRDRRGARRTLLPSQRLRPSSSRRHCSSPFFRSASGSPLPLAVRLPSGLIRNNPWCLYHFCGSDAAAGPVPGHLRRRQPLSAACPSPLRGPW